MKEFLIAFLGRTLNLPPEKVAALLNADGTGVTDTALNELLALDATRVQAFKTEAQTMFDNGYKKAQKEVLGQREKEIKDKFGIASEKQGIELIEDIITQKAGNKEEIDANKVKTHPEYIRMQDELTKQVKAKDNEWKEKYEKRDKEIASEKTFTAVSEKAKSVLSLYGLPENEALAKNQQQFFFNDLKGYGFQPHGDNDYVVLDAEGKPVNDDHGHRKSFESILHEIAGKYWIKKDGKEREGGGGDNHEGNKGGQGTKANPFKGKITNDADYTTAIANAKSGDERIQIDEAYEAHKGGVK